MNVIERIKNTNNYTKKQKQIADFLVENAGKVCYSTLFGLCEEINCSEVTMLNFCRKIGYLNFLDLKNDFRKYSEENGNKLKKDFVKDKLSELHANSFFNEIMSLEIEYLNNLFASLSSDRLNSIAKEIIRARYVVIVGHDFSNKMGSYLRDRLNRLNLSAILVDPSDMVNAEYILNQVGSEDMVIYFSFPDYFYATDVLGKMIRQRTEKILIITDSEKSPAAGYAKYKIICDTAAKVFDNTWLAPFAFIDIITNMVAININKKEGFKWD